MEKKRKINTGGIVFIFIILIMISIPLTSGEESPAGSVSGSSTIGARGGGCDYYADLYQRCFFVNESIMCEEGCQEGFVCGEDYRCSPSVISEEEEDNAVIMCGQKTTLLTRLKDDCKFNNSVCEDAEIPLKDDDCSLNYDSITCKARCIFKELWFAKLLLIGLVAMALFYKQDYGVMVLIVILLLVMNFSGIPQVEAFKGNFGNLSMESKDVAIVPNEQFNENYVLRYGSMVLSSNPVMGFLIILLGLYFITRYLAGKFFGGIK